MRIADLIDPFARIERPPPRTLWRFILWCLSGSWAVMIFAGLASAFVGALEVVTALILGRIIDAAAATGPESFFATHWWLVVGFVAYFLLLRPLSIAVSAASNAIIVQPNLGPQVQSRLLRWTMGHSVRFFDEDFAGRITQKKMQVATGVTEVMSEFLNTICYALAALVGSILLLFTIDWRIALAFVVWCFGYWGVLRFFMPRVRVRAKARANARSDVTGQVVDTITNIKTVKLFAHDAHEDQVALRAMGSYRDRMVDFGVLSAAFRFSLMAIAGVLPVLMVGGTVLLWSFGGASVGDIAASGAIALRISQMTGWVSFTLMAMYAQVGEIEDGMHTLTPPHELTDAKGARTLMVRDASIRFEDVSFAYGREAGGISGVDLTIPAGQKVGIVGASGAGKSTLVSLLLRLYDTEGGRILIDGQDVAEVTQESLRRHIGMVTQDTAMFNRSARDNILYGRPDAHEDEVLAAAQRAEAHDFILDLQDAKGRAGYDAFLGERGVKLSGGQRQRIALARTILKDAPILVLDEATSALDSEVEAAIQDALEKIMDGKTVLAIAHRLSTIARMDRIIVMDGGQVVEDGTHEDLLSKGGLYARYWTRQSGGFIDTQEAAE